MKKGTVLILGGAGLVGHACAVALLAVGFPKFNPVIVDRREPLERLPGVQYVIGDHVDVFDRVFMHGLARQLKPIAIIDSVNIASLTSKSTDIIDTVEAYVFGVLKPLAAKGIVIVDVGTVGTGGMGCNIPYTHNEASDGSIARGLIRKIAAASVHGGLLDAVGRTPDHRVGRVIPRAMIGFGKPFHGPVSVAHLKGRFQTASSTFLALDDIHDVTFTLNGPYENVGVSCGENGEFATEETDSITSTGQMEAVTAEAVASAVLDVMMRLLAKGGSYINRDVHPDLTSKAVRDRTVKEMIALSESMQTASVALGNLGPLITTHLWELWVLSKLGFTPDSLTQGIPEDLMMQRHGVVANDLSVHLPSIGVPVRTDRYFCPARLGSETSLTRDEVMEQLRRTELTDDDRLWAVDIRHQRLQFWVEAARLVHKSDAVRSNLPLAWKKPLRPGAFWAAFMTADKHGRQAYSQGSRG